MINKNNKIIIPVVLVELFSAEAFFFNRLELFHYVYIFKSNSIDLSCLLDVLLDWLSITATLMAPPIISVTTNKIISPFVEKSFSELNKEAIAKVYLFENMIS